MRCDPQLLWTLVHQQGEPPEKVGGLFSHLETCATCRDTLAELSGGSQWAQDASRWLADVPLGSPSQDAQQEARGLAGGADLSFLAPPCHPEMLGRIDRYDIEGVLGRGGMGLVLRGFDAELQRPVAIKVLAPEWAASEAARRRFAREAQAAASVAHESVVPIYNVGADASPPYIVMRYIPGVTLEQFTRREGPLAPGLILRITSQLAAGLAAAHVRGLVHRDVKPANVLVGENTDRVWLTDFGLARAADEARMTRTGVIAGTPHYMSPEQARGEPLDARSDWFSLGCLVYFLCTGAPPFDAPTTLAILQQTISAKPAPLDRLRGDLPPALVDLVHRLLNKRADRRPSTLDTVEEYLHRADQQLAKGFRVRTRFAMRRMGIAVGLAALMIGGAVYWLSLRQYGAIEEELGWPLVGAPSIGASTGGGSDTGLPVEPPVRLVSDREFAKAAASIEGIPRWNEERFFQEVQQIEQAVESLEQ